MNTQGEPHAGETLPNGGVLTDRYAIHNDWQIWNTQRGSALLVSSDLCNRWIDMGLVEPGLFLPTASGLWAVESQGYPAIASVELGPYPQSGQQVLELAKLFAYTRKSLGDVHLGSALFIPQFPYLMPVTEGDDHAQDPWTLGRWFSGGMNVPVTDGVRMRAWVPGLTDDMYTALLALFGWEETAPEKIRAIDNAETQPRPLSTRRREHRREGPFSLPGRPKLEKFFRERIIDVIDREEAYRRMGIEFPGATLLVGPPGCGKTYAVEQLVDYLGWPSYAVNADSIGSAYMHETSRLVSQLFSQAISDAPSVVIMDEMESYLTDRDTGHQHHVEEVAEFLRAIPELPKNRVLLFGMTNMPDSIDKAITRKGRFDNIIEVDAPARDELAELLESLLKDVPTQQNLDLDHIAARLLGRPISDVVYVAREAGRLAVLNGEDCITGELLSKACDDLMSQQHDKKGHQAIGFL